MAAHWECLQGAHSFPREGVEMTNIAFLQLQGTTPATLEVAKTPLLQSAKTFWAMVFMASIPLSPFGGLGADVDLLQLGICHPSFLWSLNCACLGGVDFIFSFNCDF